MKNLILLLAVLTNTLIFAGIPSNAEDTEPLMKGDTVPEVELRTVEGKTVKLDTLVAEQPGVLIFYRGSWCPYCNRHLASLMDIEEDLQAIGFRLLAISPDKPEKLKEAIEKNELGYTLLSDSSAEAIREFGLAFEVGMMTRAKYKAFGIDLEKASGEDHHLLPVPAVYVVSTDGIIQFSYTNPDYKTRLSAEEVLEVAKKNASKDR